jgi:hypothetical protein
MPLTGVGGGGTGEGTVRRNLPPPLPRDVNTKEGLVLSPKPVTPTGASNSLLPSSIGSGIGTSKSVPSGSEVETGSNAEEEEQASMMIGPEKTSVIASGIESRRMMEVRMRLKRKFDEMPRVGNLRVLDVKGNDIKVSLEQDDEVERLMITIGLDW